MPKFPKVDRRKLQAAYYQDLADIWRQQTAAKQGETPYAYFLFGTESYPEFTAHVLTEEGLTAVAEAYLKKGYYETLKESRDALRYSVPDSQHFHSELSPLVNVNHEFGPHAETLGETAGYMFLAEAAIKALKKLDEEGLFGPKQQREKLLLACITEGTDTDWTEDSLKQLNSKAAYERFLKHHEVDGPHATCESLVLAPDGRRLFFSGSRDSSRGDDQSDAELVGCALQGLRLKRKWSFSFPLDGDSMRQVIYDTSTDTVLTVRATYQNGECLSRLMRFPLNRAKPIKVTEVDAEPNQLAVSPDGSRIALTTHEKSLLLFDSDLECVAEYEFGFSVNSPLWLKRNRLLIGSDKGVLEFSARTGEYEQLTTKPAYRISTDAKHKHLAVSRWYDVVNFERKPFGFQVYRLSTMELVREYKPKDCESVIHALSADGKKIVCHASDTKTSRKWVVVFDVASGDEIARRRVGYVNDLVFLSDHSTLAIAASGFYKHEAVEFWSLPEH